MSRDDATLVDIVGAAHRAIEFCSGYDRATFLADARTQSAVIHQLLVIGEAVKRLSDAFRAQHSGVPWRPIAGMRDRLIHQYDAVDLDEVWNTVKRDVPKLLGVLEPLLPPNEDDPTLGSS
jgi:uncharacterized protein with HEPN domain